MGPYVRGGQSTLKDECTAGERKLEEDDCWWGRVDRCSAYYNQITQGEGGADITVCLMGIFPGSPAEIPLTRSQNTQTNWNAADACRTFRQTHTHTHSGCQHEIISVLSWHMKMFCTCGKCWKDSTVGQPFMLQHRLPYRFPSFSIFSLSFEDYLNCETLVGV